MARVGWVPAACTAKQLGYLEFLCKQAGMSHEDMETVARQVIDREPDNWLAGMDITQSEANRVIACLKVLVKLKGGRVNSSRQATETCTLNQRRYIETLRTARGMSYHAMCEHMGVSDIGQLTKQDASEVIEWLKR